MRNIGAFRKISGTLTNRIIDPRTNTWFINRVSPVRPMVRVTSIIDKFMLSSFSMSLPRYVSPVVSSSEMMWPCASLSRRTGIPADMLIVINLAGLVPLIAVRFANACVQNTTPLCEPLEGRCCWGRDVKKTDKPNQHRGYCEWFTFVEKLGVGRRTGHGDAHARETRNLAADEPDRARPKCQSGSEGPIVNE